MRPEGAVQHTTTIIHLCNLMVFFGYLLNLANSLLLNELVEISKQESS